MIQLFLMTLLLLFNFIFMNMKHPLAMGLTLLIQTTLICLLTGLMTKTFWYSYILFLVFLGGMLVLFIYITSLASNEMFSLSIKLMIFSIFWLSMYLIIYFIINKNYLIIYLNNEMKPINLMDTYFMENSLSTNKLYNYPNNLMTIMLMNYLLITLFAVIKITKLQKGPLRHLFN